MGFASVEEIETRAKEQECQLWETILHDDMTERQVDRLESIGKMSSMYLAMKDANESYDKDLKSQSGLSGGDGEKMMEEVRNCLLYTSPSPRDLSTSRMPSSA